MGQPHAAVSPNEASHHGHAHGGPDHVPHVLPLSTYFATWGALMLLTAITVGASYVNFGTANVVIALVIATLKATIVAALFMHLWFDHKFHAVILLSTLLFLMIFIAFTMFDTGERGRGDAIRAERPNEMSNPFGGSQSEVAARARASGVPLPSTWLPPGRGETAPAPAASASGMPPAGLVAGGAGSAVVTAASLVAGSPVGSAVPPAESSNPPGPVPSASAPASASAVVVPSASAPHPAPAASSAKTK